MDPGTGSLTDAQLAELRAALEAKRAELRRVIAARLRATAEDDEELIEEGDVATRGIGVTEAQAVVEIDRRLLGEVEHALSKMDRGGYGVSEVGGDPIPYARLRAIPWARVDTDEEDDRERRRR